MNMKKISNLMGLGFWHPESYGKKGRKKILVIEVISPSKLGWD